MYFTMLVLLFLKYYVFVFLMNQAERNILRRNKYYKIIIKLQWLLQVKLKLHVMTHSQIHNETLK